jgi:hypothetical protein
MPRSITSVDLVGVKAAIQQYFPREQGVVFAEWRNDLDAMAVKLQRTVWCEQLTDESVLWPTTWWDAFKERWFPRWWLRRWPANYSHADFTVYRAYPDLSLPEHRHTLFIQRQWPEA